MVNETKEKSSSKGWLLGGFIGIVITAVVLIIIFIIISILGYSYFYNETIEAKKITVRSNVVLIRDEILLKLTKDGLDPSTAIAQAIDDLNTDKDLRQKFSPFSEDCKPFSSEPCPGSVVAKLENTTKISITGYDDDGEVLLVKNLIKDKEN